MFGIIKNVLKKLNKKKKIFVPYLVNTNELLKGKNIIITGGSSGIGYAIAKEFSDLGGNIVIAGSNEKRLIDATNSIDNSKYVIMDLEHIEKIDESIMRAVEMFDKPVIDILVNCAGITDKNHFLSVSQEEFERVLKINVEGYYFCSQSVSKIMIKNKTEGHILNVSSSSESRPASGPYKISKWAIRGMTLGLAQELLPYGIIVNAIAPGKTATPMMKKESDKNIACSGQPVERYCDPKEIAQLASFMVSDAGNMIVGDTFFISGGNGTITI